MYCLRVLGAVSLAAWLLAGTAMADDDAGGAVGIHKVPSASTMRLARDKALAREDLTAGRFADAYHLLRPDVAEARGDAEFLALLALAALRSGSYGEAAVIYDHLARTEPGNSRWRVGLGLAREQLGLDATGDYRQALSLSGETSELRALLEAKLKDLARADVG